MAIPAAGGARPFRAQASITPNDRLLGESAVVYTLTVKNTGGTRIGSLEVRRPAGAFTILSCRTVAPAWRPTRSASRCLFQSAASTRDDLRPGATKRFSITARLSSASADSVGNWGVSIGQKAKFKAGKGAKGATGAAPAALSASAHSFEVLDAVVGSSAAPGSPCPAASKSAVAGHAVAIVICGKNRTSGTLTPTAAQSSLAGTFVDSAGSFSSGPVPGGSSASVVLGQWSGAVTTASVATNRILLAKIGAAANQTSHVTALTGYSTIANAAPSAGDDGPLAATEDTPLAPSAPGVLANDSDPNGDALSAVLVAGPTHAASFALHADGSFSYTPAANYNGPDSFTYSASDGSASSAAATVTLAVAAVNDAPVNIVPSGRSVAEDTPLVLSGAGNRLAVSDVDAGSAPMQVRLAVTSGALTLFGTTGLTFATGDGTADPLLVFTGTISAVNTALDGLVLAPLADYNGPVTLSLTTNDQGAAGGAPQSDLDSVAVTVTPVNDTPVASPASPITTEDTPKVIALHATDIDGDTLTYSIVSGPSHGLLGTISGGSVTYTPTANFSGSDSFSFRANDGTVDSNVATVSMTVSPVNDAPLAADATETTAEDVAKPITLAATDAEGSLLTYSIVSGPSHGSLGTLTGSGVTYTPNANFNGSDSFTFKANDGTFDSNVATVSMNVTAVNDGPVNSIPATLTPAEDTVVSFTTASGHPISVADPDIGSSPIQISLQVSNDALLELTNTAGLTFVFGDGHLDTLMVFQGALGTVNTALQSLQLIPTSQFNGVTTLTMASNDLGATGAGGSIEDVDNLQLTFTAVNDAPLNSVPGPQTTNQNTSKVFSAANGNRIATSDVDATTVQVTIGVAHGTLTLAGVVGLVFTVGDGTTDATMTFTGTVAAVNTALATLTYAPTAAYFGPDTLTLTTNDQGSSGSGGPLSDTDTVAITVTGPNAAPVNTVPGAQTVGEDTPLVFSAANTNAISTTDADAGASPMKINLDVTNGTLNLSGTTGLTFTTGDGTSDASMAFTGTLASVNAAFAGMSFLGTPNFNGSAVLTLKTDDQGATGSGGAKTDTDTVAITVSAVNDAPVNSVPGAQAANEDTPLVFSSANGNLISTSDVDIAASPVKITLGSTNGTLTLSGIGGLTFTTGDGTADSAMVFTGTLASANTALAGMSFAPTANFSGAASVSLTADDQGATGSGGAKTDVDSVTVNVAAVNDAPVNTVPGAQTVNTDSSKTFSTGNGNAISIADIDAAPDTVQVALSVAHGALTLSGTTGLVFSAGDGTADAAMTFSGTLTNVNAALNGLVYAPTTDYDGPDTLTLNTSDLGHTGSGGAKTDLDTVAITVVNPPPVANADAFGTAVGNTKLTVGRAPADPSTPFVQITGNVLTNDTDPDNETPLTATAGTSATAHGGSVTMFGNGTFEFLPPAGYTGTETFTYTVFDAHGTSTPGTVSITIANMVWYVNNTNPVAGTGRSSDPFKNLSSLQGASDPDGSGDTIFVYSGSGSYTNGLVLEASQKLFGQPVGLTVGGNALVAAGGTNPVLTNTTAAITLANDVQVQGVSISAGGGGITGTSITNATVGTTNAVPITGVLGDAVHLDGAASGTITIASAIQNAAFHSISVAGRTGGTVNFSGGINESGTGIVLSSNTGATINFTGGVTASTGANPTFAATGGGTLNVTGANNTLLSSTGTTLNVSNTTIGASGLTFKSIGSNGAANGIKLDSTGSSGSLVVTSTGAGTCTAANTTGCTGGTIANTTGADNSTSTPGGTGIVLKDTKAPSLTRMWLHDNSNYAIRGTNVSGLTIANSVINGTNGTNGTDPFSDSSVWIDNLTGSASVTDTAVSGGFEDNFRVFNSSGSLDRITFTNLNVGANSTANGNDGLSLQSTATAGAFKATVQTSTFTSAAGDLLNFIHNGTGAGDLQLLTNAFSNNHPAIATGGGGLSLVNDGTSGPTTMTVTNNTFRDAVGPGILVVKTTGASTQTGTFSGNTIGVSGTANSGSKEGSALKLQTVGQGTMTWSVTGNQIHGYNNNGIEVLAGGGATLQSGAINTTITGNVIDEPGSTAGTITIPKNGIHLNIGTVPGDTYAACAKIGGAGALANTISASGKDGVPTTGGDVDFRLRQRQSTTIRLPGYAGANNDAAAVQSFVAANNGTGGVPVGLASFNVPPGGGFTGTGTTCP